MAGHNGLVWVDKFEKQPRGYYMIAASRVASVFTIHFYGTYAKSAPCHIRDHSFWDLVRERGITALHVHVSRYSNNKDQVAMELNGTICALVKHIDAQQLQWTLRANREAYGIIAANCKLLHVTRMYFTQNVGSIMALSCAKQYASVRHMRPESSICELTQKTLKVNRTTYNAMASVFALIELARRHRDGPLGTLSRDALRVILGFLGAEHWRVKSYDNSFQRFGMLEPPLKRTKQMICCN